MTLDKIRTGTGRRFRTEGLQETTLPIPYDAAAMPGATVLGTDGQAYQSVKSGNVYIWSRPLGVLQTGEIYFGLGTQRSDIQRTAKPGFQFESSVPDSPDKSRLALIRNDNSSATGHSGFFLCRSRGATPGAVTIVQDGDTIGSISWQGADGVQLLAGMNVRGRVDGAPSFDIMPVRLDVGSAAVGGLAVTLKDNGNLLLGNTTGTERLSVTGNIQLTNTADSFKVGTNNVVGSRKTGWAAPTGTATRTTFATTTVTTEQLAERVKALIDDLTSHGLIGA